MLREFLQKKKGHYFGGEEDIFGVTEQPELSLGPSSSFFSDSNANIMRKRKPPLWEEPMAQSSIELQLQAPLPPDWEQCLDLQSGRMYYVNRRTLKKSWEWPREHKLDLELNISMPPHNHADACSRSSPTDDSSTRQFGGSRMVAVPCLRCHLLVMLSTSSPSCPNCKFVHSLADLQKNPNGQSNSSRGTKPLETLSLLH